MQPYFSHFVINNSQIAAIVLYANKTAFGLIPESGLFGGEAGFEPRLELPPLTV